MPYTHTRKWKQHQEDDPTCNIDNLIAWTLDTPTGRVIKQDLQRVEAISGELVQCTFSDNGRASMSFKFALSLEGKTITTKLKLAYVTDEEGNVQRTATHVYECDGHEIVPSLASTHELIAPGAGKQMKVVTAAE